MTKKADVWMPFLVDKYLGDTTNLTTEQHGAYMLLLLSMWKKDGFLPADDIQLAQITRLSPARWRAQRPILIGFFREESGLISQKRLAEELARAKKSIAAKSKAGAEGAAKRWGGDGEPMADPMAEAMADPLPNQSQTGASIPIHKDSPTERKERKPSASSARPTIPCPYEEIVARYHAGLPEMPRVKLMTADRQRALRKVWGWVLSSKKSDGERRAVDAKQALHWFEGYFHRASENDFLMGRTQRAAEHQGWKCDLDFLLTDRGMKQVIEKTAAAA